MPATTNYGWIIPTPGGDTGVWDTILNDAVEDIDAQVFDIESNLVAGLGDFRIAGLAGLEVFTSGTTNPQWFYSGANHRFSEFGANVNDLLFPLGKLPVGQLLDEIRSFGHVTGGQAADVDLIRVAANGTVTVVSAGHALPGATAETETTGIAHTILADTDYFVRVTTSGVAGTVFIKSVGFTTAVQP